jgi:hypothetical protein
MLVAWARLASAVVGRDGATSPAHPTPGEHAPLCCARLRPQARIVGLNAQYFLKNGGNFVISIKASCIDSTAAPEAVFAREVKKLIELQLKPKEQVRAWAGVCVGCVTRNGGGGCTGSCTRATRGCGLRRRVRH